MEESIEQDPENPMSHYRLGTLYKKKGELEKASEHYQKALSIQPEFSNALNQLALIYMKKGEDEKAISLLRKMIELNPEIVSAYYNLACIYAKQNRVEQSIYWVKKAIEKGFNDWNLLKTDKDLENIKDTLYYKGLIKNH